MADLNKAIQVLADAKTTRKDIKILLSVTTADIQEVLGKDGRGRKAKAPSIPKKYTVSQG